MEDKAITELKAAINNYNTDIAEGNTLAGGIVLDLLGTEDSNGEFILDRDYRQLQVVNVLNKCDRFNIIAEGVVELLN